AEIPRFTLVGLVGTDWLTHTLGVWHPRVKANLRQFDEFLKDFLALLKQSGIMEKTYIVVTGDHGAHDIDGLFDLKRYLRSNGLRLIGRLRRRQPDAIYVGARGVGSSIVSVPGEGGWDTDPTIERLRRFPATNGRGVDLIALLLNAPEVMLVAVREDAGHIRLFQRDGEAVITVRNETLPRYGYTVLNNGWDPLGFRDDPSLRSFTDGRLLNAWQWARLTNSSDFPDAVVQLGQVFADRRAGDLVVISAPRWGFYHEKEATHGSIILVDLRVPLLIRGPTIRSGRYDWARLVDLYPTMRHWFGLGETDMPIDGRLLQLR
ncbi:MAG: alkaline phosphatase family protein, partial [Deltaproteobacteria bacterium]|nr:alkaline phosphatase family protein [Deltaproteobacteria bacterium]